MTKLDFCNRDNTKIKISVVLIHSFNPNPSPCPGAALTNEKPLRPETCASAAGQAGPEPLPSAKQEERLTSLKTFFLASNFCQVTVVRAAHTPQTAAFIVSLSWEILHVDVQKEIILIPLLTLY